MISDAIAIDVNDITKTYKLYNKPVDRLKEALHPFQKKYHHDFFALNGVSFQIKRGETVGILGKNGAGKSTLLKIITGVLTPSSGSIRINGKIASLLELGAGFNPEYTGLENIFFQGSLMGFTREEIESKIDAILTFADIGEFIHQPVKMYSSGMYARLAFSVSINVEPDILIIDEALSVGDARFQAKCFALLKKIQERGTAILLVTHSTEQVVTNCNRAILIDAGRVVNDGLPKDIVNQYLDMLFGKPETIVDNVEKTFEKIPETTDKIKDSGQYAILLEDEYEHNPFYSSTEYRWGDKSALIQSFLIMQGDSINPPNITLDANIRIIFKILFVNTIVRPIFGFSVKTKEGVTLYNTNTEEQRKIISDATTANEIRFISVEIPPRFATGDYFLSAGIASRTTENDVIPHDRRYDSIHINIQEQKDFFGLVNLNVSINDETAR